MCIRDRKVTVRTSWDGKLYAATADKHCAIFTVVCWAMLIGLSFLLYGETLLSFGGLPMLLANTFAFALVSQSIGFLVSSFVKSFTVLSAISNVLSLGLCFISGVFVPQAIMSPGVLTAASFLPVYWYVKANNAIGSLAAFTSETTNPIWTCLLYTSQDLHGEPP